LAWFAFKPGGQMNTKRKLSVRSPQYRNTVFLSAKSKAERFQPQQILLRLITFSPGTLLRFPFRFIAFVKKSSNKRI
jgi:hypothetical protein